MKRSLLISALSICALLVFPGGRTMEEGMWMLDSLGKLPIADMKKTGLELTPEQIYSQNGPSLKDAVILLGGGTASFISSEGLILTNHHVAFSGIQSLSSVEDDYLKNGFWAKTRSEELSTTYSAQLVVGMKDVTKDILSAVSDTMTPEERAKAIQTKSQQLEKEAKGSGENSCRVSEIYSGLNYYLFTYQPINDIRLVYAPPSAIGNFGGEVDNWIWPRHTGDFSLMRAYVAPDGKAAKYSNENVPYKPKVFLPISTHGYSEGSFAMIMGFPGRTFRYREASAVEVQRDVTLPTTIDLYKTRMNIIENACGKDRAVEIKYASRVRGLANTYKNYLGTLEGMRHSDLLTLKRSEELEFGRYLHSTPELSAKYGTLLDELAKADGELRSITMKQVLLMNLSGGTDVLRIANRFRSYAASFPVDSLGNNAAHGTDKDQASLREFIVSTFKNFDAGVDRQTLVALILKSSEMPADQQVAPFRKIVGDRTGSGREEKVREFVDELYRETALATRQGCEEEMGSDAGSIGDDPFVRFAASIDADQAPVTAKSSRINATLTRLRAKFIEAWLGWKKNSLVYPDANRTLRFTYGKVESFTPRDAVRYDYCTTLAGVVEKEQPEDPFIVPAKLKDLWAKKDFGRYADPKHGDVPVAFIADMDITGGNSGSPVLNGRGELIGCAFDGNWEAVVGDYLFQEQYNRTISVDARYVLFVLDKFSGAENILKELVIH